MSHARTPPRDGDALCDHGLGVEGGSPAPSCSEPSHKGSEHLQKDLVDLLAEGQVLGHHQVAACRPSHKCCSRANGPDVKIARQYVLHKLLAGEKVGEGLQGAQGGAQARIVGLQPGVNHFLQMSTHVGATESKMSFESKPSSENASKMIFASATISAV
jgi:hypothetical protein